MLSAEQWTRLDDVSTFADGSARNVGGVTVFLINKQWYVTETRCPHMGYPMSKGTIRDGIVTCAWHKWDFDLKHGACYRGACDDLRVYPHKIEDGALFINKNQTQDQDDSWKRLLPEAMMQGDRFLLAKIIHRAIEQGTAIEDITSVAHQQSFRHAIRAHQSMQAVRELHAISISANMAHQLNKDQQTHCLLHGLGIASGPAGVRPEVIPLPEAISSEALIERLTFYCQESSSLGIERLLLSAHWEDVDIDHCLLSCASSQAFLHLSETFIGTAVCLQLKQNHNQDILAAELAWILGARRDQAPADTVDAINWLKQEHDTPSQQTATPCSLESLEQSLDGNHISSAFELCRNWLHHQVPFTNILDQASLLCARRLARLSLNNGGLWRDASRGLRLCAAMRSMHQHYPEADTDAWAYMLFYFLFETRWLQTSSKSTHKIDPADADWDACQAAYEHLALRECRNLCLSAYAANPQTTQTRITGMLIRDDLDYELLATIDVIFSEMQDQDEWQPYLSGLITYAIDQRNRRGSLAAAQFGNSFTNSANYDQ